MADLQGRTAWITGGGSGIGAAGALALARAGAEVVVSGRRAAPLEALVARIAQDGGTARALPLDVADGAAVDATARQIGRVDILVASAGLNVPDRAMAVVRQSDWARIVDVNLTGVFHAAHAVLPGMRAAGGGVLILVSSWAGRHISRLTGAAYSASKHGVVALSESINAEEGGHGIRSTALCPGEVATDILRSRPQPPSAAEQARMLQSEDLGETIRFVATMPARVCLNEIVISPTWNRFYRGFAEVDG